MSLISSSVIFVALSVAVLYLVRILTPRKLPKGAQYPPGPWTKAWPVLGNAPDLADGQLIPVFNRWAEEYGPIAQFTLMGEKQVVLSSEKAAHDLFVTRSAKYSDRGTPYAMKYITRDLNPALMPKNAAWRRERKFMHQAISITSNEKYQGFMADEATRALKDLLDRPTDYYQQFTRYSYSVLTRCILGFPTLSADDKFVQQTEFFIDEAMKCFRPDEHPANLLWPLRYLPTWALKSLKSMETLRDHSDQDLQRTRDQVEAQVKAGTALESLYADFLQNRDEYDISDQEAACAFQSMIGGGTRSPRNFLLNYCILMMQYPEWQEKLQQQIDEVVGSDRLPTSDDIPQLPLVRAVVKEGIRYRSIVAELGIPHQLEEDDLYEGYFFEKGTVFHANYGQILMEKDMYPDQQAFNPARWIDPSYPTYKEPLEKYPNVQNFAAFGYGRRSCPGYDFAERTLVIMVAKLAWACTIKKPVDPQTKEPVVLDIKYEPTPNPGPLPFPCDIVVRSQERARVVAREAENMA